MLVSDMPKALVLGRESPWVEELEHILARHSFRVTILGNHEDVLALRSTQYELIVLTDSLNDDRLERFWAALRHSFPKAKFLCLLNHFTDKMELMMRRAGVIFLGSYTEFDRSSREILDRVLESFDSQCNTSADARQVCLHSAAAQKR